MTELALAQSSAGSGVEALFLIFPLIIFAMWGLMLMLMILGAIFWIMMIVDVTKRVFPDPNNRIVWVLVVILAGIPGAAIYYFVVKRPGDQVA